jgi:hypothetical protein
MDANPLIAPGEDFSAPSAPPVNSLVVSGEDFSPGPAKNVARKESATAAPSKPLTEAIPNVVNPPPEGTPLGWGEMASGAVQNVVPSAERAAMGVYETFRHPLDTANALWDLGVGVQSKLDGLAGEPQDQKVKAKKEKTLDNVMQMYSDRYNGTENIKRSFMTDPVGTALDALTLWSGAGGLARGAMGAVESVVGGAGKIAATGLSDAEKAAIEAGTGLKAAEIPDEAVPAFKQTFQEKGATPDAAAEALIKHTTETDQVPNEVITRQQSTPVAKEQVNTYREEGMQTVNKKLAGIAGGAPDQSGLASALEDAYVKSANARNDAYRTFFSMPGEVNSSISATLPSTVAAELDKYNMPSNLTQMAKSPETYQNSLKALQYLQDRVTNLDMPLGGSLTLPNFERVRQELNTYFRSAQGSDRMALRAIIDGYDNALGNTIRSPDGFVVPGLAPEESAAAAQNASDAMQAARNAHKNHLNTFENSQGVKSPIATAIRTIKGDHTLGPDGMIATTAPDSTLMSAQKPLAAALNDPARAAATYDKLMDLFGEPKAASSSPWYWEPTTEGGQALQDYMRKTILRQIPDPRTPGFVPKLAKNKLAEILYHPIAQKVFSPSDLSRAKMLNVAQRYLHNKPILGGNLQRSMTGAMTHVAMRGVAAWLGEKLGHAVGMGGLPGALAGMAMERGVEHLGQARAVSKQFRGANSAKPGIISRAAASVGNVLKSPITPSGALLERALQQPRQAQMQYARASGGPVSKRTHEQLVSRLMDLAEKAKKDVNKDTKPLLNAPDEAVVKALAVAQRAI